MRTVVILSTFLLAVSGTPIGDISDSSILASSSTKEEDSPVPAVKAGSTADTEHGEHSHAEKPQNTDGSTGNGDEDPEDQGENANESSGGYGGANNDSNAKDEPTSLNNSASTTYTEDGKNNHAEQPQNTDGFTVDEDEGHANEHENATEPSGGSGGANNDKAKDDPTSLNDSASTTSTEGPTIEDSETKNITVPDDADPVDCQARNPKKHIYLECQFSCQGDMMELAQDNSTCLLNYTGNAANDNDSNWPNWNKRGVCQRGECVPNATQVTTANPESSPTGVTFTTGFTETIPDSTPTGTATTIGVTENVYQTVTPKSTITPGSSSTERNASSMKSGMESKIPSNPSPPTSDFSPVAME